VRRIIHEVDNYIKYIAGSERTDSGKVT